MKYFIANLSVHIIVVIALVVIIIIASNRNKRGETKHSLTYFLPLMLSILAVCYMFYFVGPRLLDITDVANDNYYLYTGYVEEISPVNNYIVVDGVTYYINPMRELPAEGSYVKVRCTSNSNYAIEVSDAEELVVDDAEKDSQQK